MVGQKMLMPRQQDMMQAIDSRLKSSTQEYYYIIDLLRIFAVISVILDHVFSGFITGGHLGVDVFFVVSGFVVSRSLFKRSKYGFIDLAFFIKRRIISL